MFASRVTDTVMIGEVAVIIRKLSGKSLDRAREVRELHIAALVGKVGPRGDAIADAATPRDEAEPARPKADARYRDYDRQTVLRAGIKSWTADVPVSTGVDDLDDDVAETLFRAIIDLSKPPTQQQEDERKNA